MNDIVINVKGMMCTGCENRIQNALKMIDGVIEVKANYKEGTVKIYADNSVNIDVIKEKITDLDFEVLS